VYTPAAFAGDDAAAVRLIDEFPLAQLVVCAAGELHATPVPMIVRGSSLVGHLARPNGVWRHGGEALAIFTGVDGYVSPRWYEAKRTDGKVVPTWNYTTVHARGQLIAHDDPEWKLELVSQLTDRFEAPFDQPWAVTDAPAAYVETLVRAIVGIEIASVTYECKAKLSQNRSAADQAAVAAAAGLALNDGQ
jgi:transcriptional regulator